MDCLSSLQPGQKAPWQFSEWPGLYDLAKHVMLDHLQQWRTSHLWRQTREANKVIQKKSFENYQVLQESESPTTTSDHLTDVTILTGLLSVSTKTFLFSDSGKRLKTKQKLVCSSTSMWLNKLCYNHLVDLPGLIWNNSMIVFLSQKKKKGGYGILCLVWYHTSDRIHWYTLVYSWRTHRLVNWLFLGTGITNLGNLGLYKCTLHCIFFYIFYFT